MHLNGLLELLRQSSIYRQLLDDLRANRPTVDQRLMRAARPFVAAALAEDLNCPIMFLAGRVDRAHNLAEQLPVWMPDRSVERFAEPSASFYERSPWTATTIRSRLNTLARLAPPIGTPVQSNAPAVVVASAYALMQKTLPVREFRSGSRALKVGAISDPDKLLRTWLQVGYMPASIVVEPGTFSRRGGILDIFPASADVPVRIEFFGDEIESLRTFSPSTQRSMDTIDQIVVTPAREALPRFSLSVAERLHDWFVSQPDPTEDVTSMQPDAEPLANGVAFPQSEFYLPYFYSYPASLLSYAPDDALIVMDDWGSLGDTMAEMEEQALANREDKVSSNQLPPDFPLPYFTWAELQDEISTRQTLHLGTNYEIPGDTTPALGDLFAPGQRYGGQLRSVLDDLVGLYDETRPVVIVTQQAQRLAELWGEQEDYVHPVTVIESPGDLGYLTFVEGSLGEGWVLRGDHTELHLLTDAEIFGWKRPEPRRRMQPRALPPESHFADLQVGDFVVHVEYGIGRFAGLRKRQIDETEREYLVIEYSGSDLLYVPIHQADRLSRYVGADERPPQLNRLGSQDWSRTKASTQAAVQEVARELLELYATRENVQGYAFSADTPWQAELEASFPYIETSDQLRALDEVKADMERPQPMDRLICGDVGYGKTEVALRAAFKAVMDGKQVAILVPTTVLAQQHFNNFSRRRLPFPVKVEMLSRFRSPAEQRKIIYDLAEGQVDIIIGTHRLLQPDVKLKNLGLLIIDEEQRFGVTHKEQFKELRTEVDVLTLTATPIPRTLYMSLTGIRDISMIQTPPEERLPIITQVGVYDDKVIRQAVLREVDRGGQVFFVHNRVQTIQGIAARLSRVVPEASVVIGHGQMDEDRLEEVMTAFARGDYDVLLSTSIIESGLDIPNANTLIVDRADWFGLAQLYQLRGRVGRGANQAYAYFFHPRTNRLTPEARARLDTIGEQTELGAAMNIAMRDLEIRGAGDLLGTRQSGHIAAVGFHLYTQLLAQAVRHLKGEGEAPQLPISTPTVTIDLPIPAYIPTNYIPEAALRIQLYRRLAELRDMAAVNDMQTELTDRFGPLPRTVQNLLFQMRVKLLAQHSNVTAIASENGQISIRLPYLAGVDRPALQLELGHNVRVSRTAVWLPQETLEDVIWQGNLLEVLEKLQVNLIQEGSE
ncbi:MAG TPA: transcription-repair coupling factor [Aggregatilinea sp.]|uniref:transcription-repair coupling factor n=1 Tax=Aggregatilinea sp. TaxID=2806333 RepID=UPI002BAD8CBB|nr:transcription-repair coupling factor [Aggregatilinea sp.]HML20064.1 transcription-repair coupling factor [Aggregatilinea sp.]